MIVLHPFLRSCLGICGQWNSQCDLFSQFVQLAVLSPWDWFFFWSLLPMDATLCAKSLDTTILFTFAVQKYIYPSVSKVHAGSFCVSVIHQTDMDYRIFSVLMWSFLCVRIHTGGLGTHWQRVTTFLTKKTAFFFLVLLTGFWTKNTDVIESRVRCSSHWATLSPAHSHPVTPSASSIYLSQKGATISLRQGSVEV